MNFRLAVALCLALPIGLTHNVASADLFQVDSAHSSVVFQIRHSDINSIFGLFSDIQGEFTIDGDGQFDVSVGVDSINSGNEGRDRHLKSPDFFSARQFPKISFQSSKITPVDDNTLEVEGELTLRGTTRPVSAKIRTATGSGRGGETRGGIQTTFKIKRSDFKVGGPAGLGDEVTVVVSLQGVEQ